MRSKISIAGFVVTASLATTSSALAGTGYTARLTITMVEANDDRGEYRAYFEVSNPPPIGDGGGQRPTCGTSAAFRILGTPEAVKAMVSVALAAHLSGRQVSVWLDGTCEGPFSQITSVRIH